MTQSLDSLHRILRPNLGRDYRTDHVRALQYLTNR
jgi:hypothetical protein